MENIRDYSKCEKWCEDSHGEKTLEDTQLASTLFGARSMGNEIKARTQNI